MDDFNNNTNTTTTNNNISRLQRVNVQMVKEKDRNQDVILNSNYNYIKFCGNNQFMYHNVLQLYSSVWNQQNMLVVSVRLRMFDSRFLKWAILAVCISVSCCVCRV